MFNDASFAVLLHCSVSFDGYLAILDVQLLQAPAVVRNALDPSIGDHITISQAKFLQIGTAFGQSPKSGIADVALANVQRPQPRAGPSQNVDRVIADRLATTCVEVAHFVAPSGYDLQSCIGNLVAFGHGEIS